MLIPTTLPLVPSIQIAIQALVDHNKVIQVRIGLGQPDPDLGIVGVIQIGVPETLGCCLVVPVF